MRDESSFRRVMGELDGQATAKRIPPSLEDVFIRLVEGKDR
jgi:hypothetical protein